MASDNIGLITAIDKQIYFYRLDLAQCNCFKRNMKIPIHGEKFIIAYHFVDYFNPSAPHPNVDCVFIVCTTPKQKYCPKTTCLSCYYKTINAIVILVGLVCHALTSQTYTHTHHSEVAEKERALIQCASIPSYILKFQTIFTHFFPFESFCRVYAIQ